MKKIKALLVAVCAVLLVVASVFGTMAYLTSTTDEVKNTFTVGKVKITLDEAQVNVDGKALDKDGNVVTDLAQAKRVFGNNYKLMPGHTYTKDPTLTVTGGSEDAYVRLLVTINKASTLKEVFGADFLPQNYVDNTWNAQTWPCVKTTVNADDTVTYEFRYKEIVKASAADQKLDALFKSFTVPGTVKGEQLAKLKDLEIKVIGEAIQADSLETAEKAWAAFDNQK